MITPPAGRFYADPFLFQHNGRRFIFFEDYDWSLRRAVICYVEIDAGGRHCPPRVALSADCHLSYPFVFEEGDAIYMLPETAGRRTVELYRAARFPDEWTLDRVLLRDVTATDATLLRTREGCGCSSPSPSTAVGRSTSSSSSPRSPSAASGNRIQ